MEDNIESLQDRITQNLFINGILTAAPQIVEFLPQIKTGIETVSNKIDKFLGEDKMVVLTRKNGRTKAIVLNTKVAFRLSNEMKIEANENAVISNYDKEEWKAKLMESEIFQMLQEKHDRLPKRE